jgi:hypothetical protein
MKRLARIAVVALPLMTLAAVPAAAEVKTRDKTQVKFEGMLGKMFNLFGGKSAKEGVEGQTAVKGNRKATLSDSGGVIVDLTEEKLYELDAKKKQYTVTTFEELRRRMREAEEKAKQQAGKEKDTPAQKEDPQKPAKEYEVDFDVKETGQKKQLIGYDTREVVMTITVREKGKTLDQSGGLVMTSDMWLAPQIAAMKEAGEFELRYWKQLQGNDAAGVSPEQMAAAMAMYPMLKPALDRMKQESGKLSGTPLMTVMTFEAVKSTEAMAAESSQGSSSGSGGLSGMLARKMMKKEDPKQRATIFTTQHEVLEIATSVAPADLEIPAGFKEKK